MSDVLPTYINEGKKEITWLRGVLNTILEVAPLSYKQKRRAFSFLYRMPDWLIARWADVLNIDYIGGCTKYPDMAEEANSDTGRNLVQQYIESHDAVPVANILGELVSSVVMQANENSLPVDSEIVEKQVCALALAECTEEGTNYADDARTILSNTESPDHPIVNYHTALVNGDIDKIEALDTTLAGGRYGEWVAERLTEAKRFLGLEPPRFIIRYGERTPQWDLLWQRIFTGGDDN